MGKLINKKLYVFDFLLIYVAFYLSRIYILRTPL